MCSIFQTLEYYGYIILISVMIKIPMLRKISDQCLSLCSCLEDLKVWLRNPISQCQKERELRLPEQCSPRRCRQSQQMGPEETDHPHDLEVLELLGLEVVAHLNRASKSGLAVVKISIDQAEDE